MKIYTKTGDKGETGLVGGRISKNSTIINTIGNFDELNASIAVIRTENYHKEIDIELEIIQNLIFAIGSCLSGAEVDVDFREYTKELENNIDRMNMELPPLTQFILPGGTKTSAAVHLSRTICRRAERNFIDFISNVEKEKPKEMKIDTKNIQVIQKFVNRLSDYLFVLARYVNKLENTQDVYWNKSIK